MWRSQYAPVTHRFRDHVHSDGTQTVISTVFWSPHDDAWEVAFQYDGAYPCVTTGRENVAHLIAAAPQMLEVLETLEAFGADELDLEIVRARATKLIAEARGAAR